MTDVTASAQGENAAPAQPPRRSRAKAGWGKGLWIMLGILALAGGAFLLGQEASLASQLRLPSLWPRLLRPLLYTMAYIAGGLLLGQLIEGMGWSARLGALAWPLIKRAGLPREAGLAFSAAFASGVAANTLLFTSWQEGRLDRRQLVASNLLNASLPAYFLHLPTTFFVVYALLGRAAVIYFGLTLLAAVLRTVGVVVFSRLFLPPASAQSEMLPGPRPAWGEVWSQTWSKFLTRLKRLLMIVLPVYLVVYLLAQGGFFAWLGKAAAGLVSSAVLPVEAMSVVVFAVVAEFNSGFAAAGALMHSGGLDMKGVVLALLLGNMVATPVRALRHQLPHYLGIFAPKLGLELLSIGQGLRVLSVLLVTLAYGWWG